MGAQSNVVYLEKIKLETSIEVSASNSIANDPAAAVYEAIKAMKQKVETLKDFIEEGENVLKAYMGEDTTLVSLDGRKLATWNWINGAVTIDRKALETHFNDIFQVVKKVGEKTRRFTLK